MEELKVGASYLRQLNSDALAKLDQKLVLHTEGVPVAVVMPWAEHERLVGLAPVVIDRAPSDVSPELKAQVGQILSGVEHLLTLEAMMEALVRHVVELKAPVASPVAPGLPPSHLVNCIHCGERRFGATKFATVCSECKSVGHTNAPGECPRCTEGGAI